MSRYLTCKDCAEVGILKEDLTKVPMPYGSVILCAKCAGKRLSELAQQHNDFILNCKCEYMCGNESNELGGEA